MTQTRRALVLTNEAARHPFRMSLPPHVCNASPAQAERQPWWRISKGDWRDAAMTYCAGFIVVSVFFA